MFRPTHIVCHHSASTWGDAKIIDMWHRNNGWRMIGYHGVILNGHRGPNSYDRQLDGKIEPGRPEGQQGAHCAGGGMNRKALGVCLIGDSTKRQFSARQTAALVHWLATMCKRHGIPVANISQHSDHEPGKPYCAGLDMDEVRRRVTERLAAP